MNIIPMFSFTPLADLSLEKAPIRVALAGATGYLFGVVAGVTPLMCARVGIITTLAHEALFFLYSVICKDYRNKMIYGFFNYWNIAVTAVNLTTNKVTAFAFLSLEIWNFMYWSSGHPWAERLGKL